MKMGVERKSWKIGNFQRNPETYNFWNVAFGPVTAIALESEGKIGLHGHELKRNSYDTGVYLELSDILDRVRFEHPEARVLILTSNQDGVFSAGANINLLQEATHSYKVNFCKFTNEVLMGLRELYNNSGIPTLAALNGNTIGGGFEIAMACYKRLMVKDSSSKIALPEVPLLAVLPGTGGLTRLVDELLIPPDLADVLCTTEEGFSAKKALESGLVDWIYPRSTFREMVAHHATELAAESKRDAQGLGIKLSPLEIEVGENYVNYSKVTLMLD